MLPSKIKLSDNIVDEIKSARTARRIPAATLSKTINRDDSYISSLELKRLRTISSADLVMIFCALHDISEQSAIEKVESLIGIERKTELYTTSSMQGAQLVDEKNADTVSEPTAEYFYGVSSDFAEPELISDMLDTIKAHILEFYKKNPKDTVYVLQSFIKTMQFDIGFTMEILGIPFFALKGASIEKRKEVLCELIDVLKKHTSLADKSG